MGNQFDNVKCQVRADNLLILAIPGKTQATVKVAGLPDSVMPSIELAAELSRRWNLFPKLVKALERCDGQIDYALIRHDAAALLREAKE